MDDFTPAHILALAHVLSQLRASFKIKYSIIQKMNVSTEFVRIFRSPPDHLQIRLNFALSVYPLSAKLIEIMDGASAVN